MELYKNYKKTTEVKKLCDILQNDEEYNDHDYTDSTGSQSAKTGVNIKLDQLSCYNLTIYRVSGDPRKNFCERVQHVRLSKKVLYHFAKFAIINELLIIEDRRS